MSGLRVVIDVDRDRPIITPAVRELVDLMLDAIVAAGWTYSSVQTAPLDRLRFTVWDSETGERR